MSLWIMQENVTIFLLFYKVKEGVYFVVLVKEEGSGLGFSIAGGVDLEQKAVTVNLSSLPFSQLSLKS